MIMIMDSSNIASYLYPAYASYKALSLHPDSSPEAMAQVERWLMYWAVVGCWTAIEAVFGWTFSWLPFYSLFKALVLLYLSLPQSEGSTYIYRAHLAPFFAEHERDIDAFLATLRSRASTALAGGVGWAWEKAKAQLNVTGPAVDGYGQPADYRNSVPASGMHQPPTLQDPASGALQHMYGLAARYAGQYLPVALSAISAATASARGQPSSQSQSQTQSHSGGERAEQVSESMTMPVPVPTPGVRSEPSSTSLRSRTFQHAAAAAAASGYPNLSPHQIQAQALAHAQALSSARQSLYPGSGTRSVSTPTGGLARPSGLSTTTSEESLSSNAASVASNNNGRGWAEMSYEQIAREEAHDAPAPSAPAARPGMEKRRSSWWGWGGTPGPSGTPESDRPKAD